MAIRAVINGEVVEVEKFEWDMTDRPNGKKGVSYFIYVAVEGASRRDAAQRVAVKPDQFGGFHEGQEVSLPVLVTLDEFPGRKAKQKVILEETFYVPQLAAAK